MYLSHCKNLVKVHESIGFLEKLQLWDLEGCEKLQILPNNLRLISLKYINLNNCESITELPEFCTPSLKKLYLSHCKNLVKVHESVGFLEKLQLWDLQGCEKLQILPNNLRLISLKHINLNNCESITELPEFYTPSLKVLYLSHCKNLVKVHESVGFLDKLQRWDLKGCEKLQILPNYLKLISLKYINLNNCESIIELPEFCTPSLQELHLSHCKNLVKVHESVGFLDKLQRWDLEGCGKLQILPNYLRLISLKYLSLKSCESITELPEFCTPSLEELYLSHCKNLVKVHESVGFLDKLQRWSLRGCEKLQKLPNYLMLISIKYINLNNCESITELPKFCTPSLKQLHLSHCKNLVKIHESVGFLDKLERWDLEGCGKLQILPNYLKLTSLKYINLNNCESIKELLEFYTPSLKKLYLSHCTLRPKKFYLSHCKNLGSLSFHGNKNITELDFLMKPVYFPVLDSLDLSETNIVSIPESLSRFANLAVLKLRNCKQLREIQRLPQSVRDVDVRNCYSLNAQSSSRLLNQVSLSFFIKL